MSFGEHRAELEVLEEDRGIEGEQILDASVPPDSTSSSSQLALSSSLTHSSQFSRHLLAKRPKVEPIALQKAPPRNQLPVLIDWDITVHY